MSKKSEAKAQREESIARLRETLKPGDEVVCVLRRRSASGMSRAISLHIVHSGQIQSITYDAAHALEWRLVEVNGDRAIKVDGCGMDMGFHTVYCLGRILFPDGFKLAENQYGRNGDQSGFDTDGGYALRSRWL